MFVNSKCLVIACAPLQPFILPQYSPSVDHNLPEHVVKYRVKSRGLVDFASVLDRIGKFRFILSLLISVFLNDSASPRVQTERNRFERSRGLRGSVRFLPSLLKAYRYHTFFSKFLPKFEEPNQGLDESYSVPTLCVYLLSANLWYGDILMCSHPILID